jgi:hypothetical protein
MKRKLAATGVPVLVAALLAGGLVLTAGEARAAKRAQHGQASGRPVPQLRSPLDLYESYSQGRQPYPNPDRELYVEQRGD